MLKLCRPSVSIVAIVEPCAGISSSRTSSCCEFLGTLAPISHNLGPTLSVCPDKCSKGVKGRHISGSIAVKLHHVASEAAGASKGAGMQSPTTLLKYRNLICCYWKTNIMPHDDAVIFRFIVEDARCIWEKYYPQQGCNTFLELALRHLDCCADTEICSSPAECRVQLSLRLSEETQEHY